MNQNSGWQLVIPVKAAERAKQRLSLELDPEPRMALARALASDTVSAALSVASIERVIIVGDPAVAETIRMPHDRLFHVAEPVAANLGVALSTGIVLAQNSGGGRVAVLLGDLPALRPQELTAALSQSAPYSQSFVRDAEGTGTTLATGTAPDFQPRFGADSAKLHLKAGYLELHGSWPGLRHDVDTISGLRAAGRLGLGDATRAVVAMYSLL